MEDINTKRKNYIGKKIWAQRYLMILTLPAVLWMIIFNYVPMYGVIIAFKNYEPYIGFLKSPWVGLANFKELFADPTFISALFNTLKISILKLICGFPAPILFAILLNELAFKRAKKLIQTLSYLPYFVSWVFVVGFMYSMLDPRTGVLSVALQNLHIISKETLMMADSKYFLPIVIVSDIWKGLGWNSIIYLAAITGIDGQLYEAATVDGAGRFKRMWHITLPALKPTIVILLILSISGLMNSNFDQLFLMQNSMTQDAANVIGIYSYKMGIVLGRFSYGTTVGLFQSVVSMILLVLANYTSRKLTDESLF